MGVGTAAVTGAGVVTTAVTGAGVGTTAVTGAGVESAGAVVSEPISYTEIA